MKMAAPMGAKSLILAALLFAGQFGPVLAQSELGSSHDTSLPIEIAADSMEVEQERQVATFRGSVDAQQGDLRLRADVLIVHYQDKTDGGGKTISLIEADGNVFVSSPEETAQGTHGVYDVTARTIALDGPVTLTRGDNVIQGERLELELETGVSRVIGGGQGRVKGVFVPEQGTQP
jgi:lipopolysaccharide export system protein LptA